MLGKNRTIENELISPFFRMLLARTDVQVNLKGKDGVTALGISFKQ